MLWVLMLILLPGSLYSSTTREPPQRLQSEFYYWPEYLSQEKILLLTEEIVKDVELKMVMIQYIQQTYFGSFDYEIGYLASSVKDLFRHMLMMYKDYCQPGPYANRTTDSADYLELLHKFQGDYREILLLRDLYLKCAEDEEIRLKKERHIEQFKSQVKKTFKAGGGTMSREELGPEQMRPTTLKDQPSTRTLQPGQKIPKNSAEYEALKNNMTRQALRDKKIQDEENYKALLRQNFKARRGERQDAAF